jgi:hypothetical protein
MKQTKQHKQVKTILVNPNTWKKLKLYCVENDLVIGDVIADLVEDYLHNIKHTGINSSSGFASTPKLNSARAEKHYFVEDDVMARQQIKKGDIK